MPNLKWLDNLSSPSVNSYLISLILFTSPVHDFEALCSTVNIYYQVVIANKARLRPRIQV
jgi:hypothetical protein